MSEATKKQEKLEKIEMIFSDADFMEGLFQLRTLRDAQDAFAKSGVNLSEEEFRTMRELLDMMEKGDFTQEHLQAWQSPAENRELTDDDLDMVSGGVTVAPYLPVEDALEMFLKYYDSISEMQKAGKL